MLYIIHSEFQRNHDGLTKQALTLCRDWSCSLSKPRNPNWRRKEINSLQRSSKFIFAAVPYDPMVTNHTCHSDVSAEVIHHGNIEDPISLVTVDTVSNYLAVVHWLSVMEESWNVRVSVPTLDPNSWEPTPSLTGSWGPMWMNTCRWNLHLTESCWHLWCAAGQVNDVSIERKRVQPTDPLSGKHFDPALELQFSFRASVRQHLCPVARGHHTDTPIQDSLLLSKSEGA